MDVMFAVNNLRTIVEVNERDFEKCRTDLHGERGDVVPYDDFEVMVYGKNSGKIAAWLIIPRHMQNVTNASFAVGRLDGGKSEEFGPLSEVTTRMAALEKEYAFCRGL